MLTDGTSEGAIANLGKRKFVLSALDNGGIYKSSR